MQRLISKYVVAAHLALLAVAPLFLFPYCGEGWTSAVLGWMSLMGLVWIIVGPSRWREERLHDARWRVAHGMMADPLFWIFVVLAVFAGLRWQNGGIAMAYDAETYRWFLHPSRVPIFPGVAEGHGLVEFWAVIATGVVVMGCRHALGRAARASFLVYASMFSGLAGIAAAVAAYFGQSVALEATKVLFRTPSFVGSVFGFYLLGGIVALVAVFEFKWTNLIFLFIIALGGTAAGLFFFAPVPVVVLFLVGFFLTLIVSLTWARRTMSTSDSFKCFVVLVSSILLAAVIVMGLSPEGMLESRLAVFEDWNVFPENFWDVRSRLSHIAAKVWREHPWLGSGLGSFPLDMRFNLKTADWATLDRAQTAVTSGWWTLIAERGIVGACAIAVPLAMMLVTYFRRFVGLFLSGEGFFFLPGCWLGLLAPCLAVAETFVDVSFLRPESLMMFGAFLAIAANSFPLFTKKKRARAQDTVIQTDTTQEESHG